MRTTSRTRHYWPDGDVLRYLPVRQPDVTPLAVYAAGNRSFQLFAKADLTAEQVIDRLLETYPAFEEHGWTERTMRVTYVGQPCERKLWRVERI